MSAPLLDVHRARQLQSAGATALRLGLAFLLALFGTFKFFQFEAHAIQPLVSHSPILGWMYVLFSVRTASAIIGLVEVGAAAALLLAPWSPRLGVVAGRPAPARRRSPPPPSDRIGTDPIINRQDTLSAY